jgi:hypothetical protein
MTNLDSNRFTIVKSKNRHLSLQPFQAVKLRKQPIRLVHVLTILQLILLLCNDGFDFFNIIVGSRPNGIYLQLKGTVYFWFVLLINLLF